MLFTYDYPYRRWGFWIRENFVTTDYMETIYVEDFRQGKATLANMQGCAIVPLAKDARMRLPCLPPDAKYIETSWLGNRTLPYDVWEWTEDEFNSRGDMTSGRIRVQISHDNCKPVGDIAWWTSHNFNYTSFIGYLDIHIGESDKRTNNPFADLARYYNCKEFDTFPNHIDARPDVFPDQIYFFQRVHATPSTPPDVPPVF
jgi:hypothetical protein